MTSASNLAVRARLVETIEARLDELPLLPVVVTRLAALDPESTDFPEAVERLARLDPALAARLLHLTRTARFPIAGMPTVGRAINAIGARRLAETITSLAVMRVFVPTTPGQRNLWRHAVGTALSARRIAEMAAVPSVAPEQAYLAGLMHDLGRFVMYDRSPQELGRVDETHWSSPAELIAAELAICGFDHASLGGLACERWGFPETVAAIVRGHHVYETDAPSTDVSSLVRVLQAADFTSILLLTRSSCLAASANDRTRLVHEWFARVGWREPPCDAGMLAEQFGWIDAETSRHLALLGLEPEAPAIGDADHRARSAR